jgi:hypothetical protein
MSSRCLEKRRTENRSIKESIGSDQLPITGENLTRLARLFALLASVPLPESSIEEGNEKRESDNGK